jgi:hypothetical protein
MFIHSRYKYAVLVQSYTADVLLRIVNNISCISLNKSNNYYLE